MLLSRRARLLAAVAALTSALAVALAGAPHSSAASGCDRVAAPTGSDSAAGTETSPYQSAQKLIDSLSAGQTGCLRAGHYTQARLRFAHGGTSGAPLTLQSYPGERATLHGIVEIASGSNNVTLRALNIDGSGIDQATLWVMSFDDTIEDSDITNTNTGTQCLILGGNGWGGPSGRLLIQRNRIHNCGRYSAGNQEHAIYFENTIDSRIIDNLFWGAAAFAIHLYPNAQRTLVAHNVIDANRQGVVFSGSTSYSSSNNTVAYNIITNTSTDDNVRSWWGGTPGTGNTAHHNCLYNGHYNDFDTQTGYSATNNTHADPHYTNPTTHDYRLPTTSPCLPIIGYDTAAKLSGAPAPAPSPAPSPSPSPDPSPTPAPSPAPEPSPQPAADTTAPTLSWTTPGSGATLSGLLQETSGNCVVAAADDVGIDRVEFFVDGTALNVELYAPWACRWDTTTTPDGSHLLKAVAYDAAGNATSKAISVAVKNTVAPVNQAPTVTLGAPSQGATFTSSLKFSAAATDDKAVTKVVFSVDGSAVATDTSAPWAATWRAGKRTGYGPHTVKATAYDAAGLTASSQASVTRVR